MSVRVLITGGTIDGVDVAREKGRATHIPKVLKQARLDLPATMEMLMLKDSREVTDADREHMLRRVQASPENHIVITHGTFTMPETAKFLGERVLAGKTVVLTGSAVPFKKPASDALFNMGGAIVAAKTLPHGVYIVMNGRVFNWNNVKKNLKTGKFEEIK